MGWDYKEDVLRHKYAELPEENKSKGKKKKSPPKKAKHKHVYENCLVISKVDPTIHLKPWQPAEREEYAYMTGYCTICGKTSKCVDDGFYFQLSDKYARTTHHRWSWWWQGSCAVGDYGKDNYWKHQMFTELYDHYLAEGKVFYQDDFSYGDTKFIKI